MSLFAPAVKQQMKARVAICGPTGSGKTWTALGWAQVLGQKIALIDTEKKSASLYANKFRFQTHQFDAPYSPDKLVTYLRGAEAEGFDVVIVDSLSHFWEAEGGTLDVVDAAAQRDARGNRFAGWKVGTPVQRHMIDTLLAVDLHVIVTMRSKMEYVLETNERGKQVPRKVGLAPVQRNDVEYEFTVVCDLDLEHRLVVSKSRCDLLADQVYAPHREKDAAAIFRDWLDDGEPAPERSAVVSPITMKVTAGLGAVDLPSIDVVDILGAREVHAECVRLGLDAVGTVDELRERLRAAIKSDGSAGEVTAPLADELAADAGEGFSEDPSPPPPKPTRLEKDAKAFGFDTPEKTAALARYASQGRTDDLAALYQKDKATVLSALHEYKEQRLGLFDGDAGQLVLAETASDVENVFRETAVDVPTGGRL